MKRDRPPAASRPSCPDAFLPATTAGPALLPSTTFILGGVRSGKTALGEKMALAAGGGFYIATAQPLDAAMAARIERHRAGRSCRFTTVEEPLRLTKTLKACAVQQRPLLVDCLTLWLCNLMQAGEDVDAATAGLLDCLPTLAAPCLFIANETGLGVMPDNAMARAFCDHAGHLNQSLAAMACQVLFVAAGLPLTLKARKITAARG